MRLHKHKKEFKQIVNTVAEEFGLGNFQVEKDYYVSLFLKELQKINANIQIVFKGGTSLSKCYDVINRFSEDIDLVVRFNSQRVTQGERKKLKKIIIEVIELLGMKFLNSNEVRSRRDHNEYNLGYNNIFQPDGNMVSHIIVETIVVYRPYPIQKKLISNYITNYLKKEERNDILHRYDLLPFKMSIQTIERTFIDKLFAICDYHLQGEYDRYSRHIYDLHMMWTSKQVDKEILFEILDKVIKDRQTYGTQNLSCQPGMNPNNILKTIIKSNVYENDYNTITSTFIYKPVDYNVCISTLRTILDEKILPENIKKY
ncbi:MAG: nucleotidyl transferase AbiEii/AbiGii toxin family protein [Candidatus Izimaplasma sp.]|nr:nucleotidyl transferase AbiEii/AbiGii toxin family protein [Candidatus Izimaplasma bacterium]